MAPLNVSIGAPASMDSSRAAAYAARMETLLPQGALARVLGAVRGDGLRLLVLFGSRARGEARRDSDWDFAFVADAGFDVDGLLAALVDTLHADRIDLVDCGARAR